MFLVIVNKKLGMRVKQRLPLSTPDYLREGITRKKHSRKTIPQQNKFDFPLFATKRPPTAV